MEPSEMPTPPMTQETPELPQEENPSEDSTGTQPEKLAKSFRNLSLNPKARRSQAKDEPEAKGKTRNVLRGVRAATRRKGIRTVYSEQRRQRAQYRELVRESCRRRKQYDIDFAKSQAEGKSVRFKCACTFCVRTGWDPSENAKIECDDK